MGQTGRSGTCNALSFELAEKEQSRAEVGFDERSLATAPLSLQTRAAQQARRVVASLSGSVINSDIGQMPLYLDRLRGLKCRKICMALRVLAARQHRLGEGTPKRAPK